MKTENKGRIRNSNEIILSYHSILTNTNTKDNNNMNIEVLGRATTPSFCFTLLLLISTGEGKQTQQVTAVLDSVNIEV